MLFGKIVFIFLQKRTVGSSHHYESDCLSGCSSPVSIFWWWSTFPAIYSISMQNVQQTFHRLQKSFLGMLIFENFIYFRHYIAGVCLQACSWCCGHWAVKETREDIHVMCRESPAVGTEGKYKFDRPGSRHPWTIDKTKMHSFPGSIVLITKLAVHFPAALFVPWSHQSREYRLERNSSCHSMQCSRQC